MLIFFGALVVSVVIVLEEPKKSVLFGGASSALGFVLMVGSRVMPSLLNPGNPQAAFYSSLSGWSQLSLPGLLLIGWGVVLLILGVIRSSSMADSKASEEVPPELPVRSKYSA